jgi:hypothetical protein
MDAHAVPNRVVIWHHHTECARSSTIRRRGSRSTPALAVSVSLVFAHRISECTATGAALRRRSRPVDHHAIRSATRQNGMATLIASATRHPPPETSLPSFRWRPLLVSGIPMRRDNRALAAERPIARFHENPPRFISVLPMILQLAPVMASSRSKEPLSVARASGRCLSTNAHGSGPRDPSGRSSRVSRDGCSPRPPRVAG